MRNNSYPFSRKKEGRRGRTVVWCLCFVCVCLHGWCRWLHCTVVCMKLLPVHRCQQPRSTDQNRQCVATRGLCVPRAETEDRLNTKNLPVLSLLRRSARVSPEHAIFKTGGRGPPPFFPTSKIPCQAGGRRIEEYRTGLRLSLLSTCLLLLSRWEVGRTRHVRSSTDSTPKRQQAVLGNAARSFKGKNLCASRGRKTAVFFLRKRPRLEQRVRENPHVPRTK